MADPDLFPHGEPPAAAQPAKADVREVTVEQMMELLAWEAENCRMSAQHHRTRAKNSPTAAACEERADIFEAIAARLVEAVHVK